MCWQGAQIAANVEDLTAHLPITAVVPDELVGGQFWKGLYRQYTDASFTVSLELSLSLLDGGITIG